MKAMPLFGLDASQPWDTEAAFLSLQAQGQADTKRTAERRLHEWSLLPPELKANSLCDEHGASPISVVLAHDIQQAKRQQPPSQEKPRYIHPSKDL